MPRPRHEYDVLPAALRFYLVHGTLPPDGSRDRGEGLVEAFTMKHAWLDRGRQPKAIADLRRLWAEHRAEIEQAAEGREPWVAVALRSPDTDDDEDDELEDAEGHDEPEANAQHDNRFNT